MVVVLRPEPDKAELSSLIHWLEGMGVTVHTMEGRHQMILGLMGDTSEIDVDRISSLAIVESVKRIQEPYKKSARKFCAADTVVNVQNAAIGAGSLTVIAGPCSIESEEQIIAVARAVKAGGATVLRGGAFKPRTSPYSFQGLGAKGIELLKLARQETGLAIVTEIMELSQLPLFEDVDIIQVGARNMQNFNLLRELGSQPKPVLLKRGMSATYEELLMSAEYICSQGNNKVILCERGIRTFEPHTRNTLDISAVPVLKKLSHFPVIVDPSHAAGKSSLVPPLAMAAVAAGADGVMIEVHNDPTCALCDGPQALKPEDFSALCKKLFSLHGCVKELASQEN